MTPGIRAALVLTGWLLLAPAPAIACEPGVAADAEAAFRDILALWKDKRYEALYERGYLEHQVTLPQEDFVRLMRREDRVLQCCWLTARNVRLACDAGAVYVTATIGYDVGGYLFNGRAWTHDTAPRDVEETWRLLWQAGAYRVDLYQVLGPSYLYYEKRPGIVRRFDFPRFPRIPKR